jgi:hypothetical protein
MKGKNLVVLLAVAVVAIVVAVRMQRREEPRPPEGIGKLVLPDLPVNDVAQVCVRSAQSIVTVARTEEAWVVREKYNYPARFEKVRELLLKLADMKIGQVVPAGDAQRGALKMQTPGAAPAPDAGGQARDATGTLIELSGEGGQTLGSVLVGAERTRDAGAQVGYYGPYQDGTFISTDAGQTVYLVTDLFASYGAAARDWLDTEIAGVEQSSIREVTISGPGRTELQLARRAEGGGGLEVSGLATNEEVESGKVSGIESALSYLRFADVADPALSDEQLGLSTAVVFRAVTGKGEIYTAQVGGAPTNSTQRYLRLSVVLGPAERQPAATNAAAEGTNAVATVPAAAEERRKLEESTAKLAAKLKPWTYLIEEYQAESLTATRSAAVKKREEAKKEEANKEQEEDKAGD